MPATTIRRCVLPAQVERDCEDQGGRPPVQGIDEQRLAVANQTGVAPIFHTGRPLVIRRKWRTTRGFLRFPNRAGARKVEAHRGVARR
jgi:hypothetical protein